MSYSRQMARPLKIVRYGLEVLSVLLLLGALIYFLTYPEAFDAALDWLVGRR